MVSEFFDKVDRHQEIHHPMAPRGVLYRLIERNPFPELATHMSLSSQVTTISFNSIPYFISNMEIGKMERIAVMMVNHVIFMVAYSTTFRYIF